MPLHNLGVFVGPCPIAGGSKRAVVGGRGRSDELGTGDGGRRGADWGRAESRRSSKSRGRRADLVRQRSSESRSARPDGGRAGACQGSQGLGVSAVAERRG